ncbi:MAG: SUMF1/EgtB/PvdO family nonheme iron enzyme [Candidatus Margulisbacteria bacterium]|nr:SUMF1/EgtB/PvdO family nonheme iron enzyme [Candidatus Margulisiibacteriota bacterium]
MNSLLNIQIRARRSNGIGQNQAEKLQQRRAGGAESVRVNDQSDLSAFLRLRRTVLLTSLPIPKQEIEVPGITVIPGGMLKRKKGKSKIVADIREFGMGTTPVTNRQYKQFLSVHNRFIPEKGILEKASFAHFGEEQERVWRALMIAGIIQQDSAFPTRGKLLVTWESHKQLRSNLYGAIYPRQLELKPDYKEAIHDIICEQQLLADPAFDRHPVVYVDWHDAVEYCAWLSGLIGKNITLPTKAQWLYAIAPDGRKYPWGNMQKCLIPQRGETYEVDHYPEDEEAKDYSFGLMSMAGNIAQWTNTEKEDSSDYVITEGAGYILFGPKICSINEMEFSWLRGNRSPDLGFRVAEQ